MKTDKAVNTKHTPGRGMVTPGAWKVLPGTRVVHAANDMSYAGLVATVEHKNDANARLIAAAPDLLSALKALTEIWSDNHDGPMPMAFYRGLEAIAKAEGGK